MKKTAIVLFLMLVVSLLAVSCSVRGRDYARNVGVPELLNKSDSITVLSAKIDDRSVIVTTDLNLNTLKLSDFEEICIKKSSPYSTSVECDIEKTKTLNDTEIFNAHFNGKTTLYFEDDSILSTDKPSEYLLCVTLVRSDGTASDYKFLLG